MGLWNHLLAISLYTIGLAGMQFVLTDRFTIKELNMQMAHMLMTPLNSGR